MGLVNKVVPLDKLDEEVDAWSQELLSKCPPCIEILKASFEADIDYLQGSFGRYQNLMYPEHFYDPMVHESHQAFFEKREADYGKFRGRPENWKKD